MTSEVALPWFSAQSLVLFCACNFHCLVIVTLLAVNPPTLVVVIPRTVSAVNPPTYLLPWRVRWLCHVLLVLGSLVLLNIFIRSWLLSLYWPWTMQYRYDFTAIIDSGSFHYQVSNQQFCQKFVFCRVLVRWCKQAMVFWKSPRNAQSPISAWVKSMVEIFF